MLTRSRLLVLPPVALLSIALAGPAQAHPGWRRHGGSPVGAVVAGAVIGAVVGGLMETRPAVEVAYMPAPVYMPPPPVVVEAPPPPRPMLGVSVLGVLDGSGGESNGSFSSGMAAALQLRTSSLTMLSLEVQSLQANRSSDGLRREDLAGLLGLRLYLWDGVVTPYLDLAAGFGRASFQCCSYRADAPQFLGRYGVGLEVRLGQHLALEGEFQHIHRVRLDGDTGPVLPLDDHESAIEWRGGVAFRF